MTERTEKVRSPSLLPHNSFDLKGCERRESTFYQSLSLEVKYRIMWHTYRITISVSLQQILRVLFPNLPILYRTL